MFKLLIIIVSYAYIRTGFHCVMYTADVFSAWEEVERKLNIIERKGSGAFSSCQIFHKQMNSISRAVTSRFNDISNKRQRLVGEGKDSDFGKESCDRVEKNYGQRFSIPLITVNPSWMDPTTSDFNCFEPPELIISEEDWNEVLFSSTTSIGPKVEKPKMILEVKASNNISKKVTSVVRRLSPFGSSNNLSKEKEEEKHDGNEEKKSQKIFKETSDGADDEAVAELVIKKGVQLH
ncbi:hypothetical protein NECAME_00092 [Necator americanus]|uniref:Uncharacterized protein n=1 Tax=Necator americanus TaxID=51031 RepID=W2TZF7_NECAM|nr:hypothetical protein NECAME_00092 [Necator americanus]ETN87233.1 hypothetical protein NECAME_00092 [Necator americanus]